MQRLLRLMYDDVAKNLNIFLLNKDRAPQQINVAINNYVNDFKGSVWQLHGASVNDKFPEFSKTDSIFEPVDISSLTLPANSVTILKLQVDNVALPVSLDSFRANKNENSVKLNWKTANENDITEYIIERSTDGTNFSPIGNIMAANKDSSLYEYTDADIPNSFVFYYRLIVVDSSGSKVSSRVVAITMNAAIQSAAIHPNPFDDKLFIRLHSPVEKTVSLTMIDVMGRIVFIQQKPLYKGNNVIEVDRLDRLMKGLYIIKMGDGSHVTTFKVVKK